QKNGHCKYCEKTNMWTARASFNFCTLATEGGGGEGCAVSRHVAVGLGLLGAGWGHRVERRGESQSGGGGEDKIWEAVVGLYTSDVRRVTDSGGGGVGGKGRTIGSVKGPEEAGRQANRQTR
ncbi:unnamed protein product, partial [Candidula unifasciata]